MHTFYKRIIAAVAVLLVLSGAFATAPAAAGGNSGAIWTTRDDCGAATQDANHYEIGEAVHINGHQFDPGEYDWEIKGLPGNASCDPGAIVASGTITITAEDDGAFCFHAYTVADDDCGEYQVKFGNKGDNYRVRGQRDEVDPLEPGIHIEKYINDEDADEANGASIYVGSTVNFKYVITNSGDVPLSGITVVDDQVGVHPVYQSGDVNNDNRLDLDETWIYVATDLAVAGPYKNIGTVTGRYEDDEVQDDDPAHYYGIYDSGCVDGFLYENGRPLANATVRLYTDGQKSIKEKTDANGYYRFEGVIRGFEYTLSVPGQPELTRTVVLQDGLACQTHDLYGGSCKPVFAMYQTWFGGADNDSAMRYWDVANKGGIVDTASVGLYDSYNEEIMEYHVLLAWASDIDALVVDWYGKESFEDGPTHKLLNTVERLYQKYHHLGFNFNIIVSYNDRAHGDMVENLKFLADSILTHPGYYGVFDSRSQPVFVHSHEPEFSAQFLAMAAQYLPPDVEILWNFEESTLSLAPYIDGFYPHVTDAADIYDPQGKAWGEAYLNAFYSDPAAAMLRYKVGGTWPGFDDRQWVEGRNIYIDRQDTLVYEKTWEKAFEHQPNWMLIQSWNSFNQTSHIEVSENEGYKFVKMSRNKAVLWKSSCARNVNDLGLTVPQALLLARQRGADSSAIDRALVEFFQGQYDYALALLDAAQPLLDRTQPDRNDQLVFVDGSLTSRKEGWENAVDGEVEGWQSTTTAKKFEQPGSTYAIFQFADRGQYLFNTVFLQTDNGSDDDLFSDRQANDVEVLVSTTGTMAADFTPVLRFKPRDGGMNHYALGRYVAAAYIKIVLHGPEHGRGNWVQIAEFGIASNGNAPARPVSENAAVATAPVSFSLEQNYPNPFNPATAIRYTLPDAARVLLKVYDMTGREVATLVDGTQESGAYAVAWSGAAMPSGIYFYHMQAGTYSAVKRMTLVK